MKFTLIKFDSWNKFPKIEVKITFPFQKNKIKLKKKEEEEGGGGILFAVGDKKEKREGFGLDISKL